MLILNVDAIITKCNSFWRSSALFANSIVSSAYHSIYIVLFSMLHFYIFYVFYYLVHYHRKRIGVKPSLYRISVIISTASIKVFPAFILILIHFNNDLHISHRCYTGYCMDLNMFPRCTLAKDCLKSRNELYCFFDKMS